MTVDEALIRCGLVATYQELLAFGVTPEAISLAVAEHRIQKPFRGIYTRHNSVADVAAARRFNGALSHLSAAHWWGMQVFRPAQITQITVPAHRHPRSRDQVDITRADVPTTLHRGVCVTTELQTVVDCLRTLPAREAVVIADSALRAGRFTQEELESTVAIVPGRGGRSARRTVKMVDPLAESILESLCRATLMDGGIPKPLSQQWIGTGRARHRVDFMWPNHRVVVEAEGFQSHGMRDGLANDCIRGNAIVLDGWILLRFAWEHVVRMPDYVVGTVAAALRLSST